jgi:two-component system, NarL family, nitrate/nitrite response regulator NarL
MSDEITQAAIPVSIVLSDVSRMRCELLAAQLTRKQPRFRIVGQAVTVGDLLDTAQRNPDVTVINGALREGALTGFEALGRLRVSSPRTNKVMLLDRCDRDLVLAAFRGGARGVFCRSGSLETFVKCLDSVGQGQIWAGNSELEVVLDALSTLAPLRVPRLEKILNRREEQLATLVAAGANNRDIGRKLNLTEKAVSEGVVRMFAKIGIDSRVELAMLIAQRARDVNTFVFRGAVGGSANSD